MQYKKEPKFNEEYESITSNYSKKIKQLLPSWWCDLSWYDKWGWTLTVVIFVYNCTEFYQHGLNNLARFQDGDQEADRQTGRDLHHLQKGSRFFKVGPLEDLLFWILANLFRNTKIYGGSSLWLSSSSQLSCSKKYTSSKHTPTSRTLAREISHKCSCMASPTLSSSQYGPY